MIRCVIEKTNWGQICNFFCKMGLATSVDERWELTRAVGVEAKCPVNKEAHVAVVEYDQKRDYEVEEEDTQLRRWG